jgi:DNA uptake protein ComE-like DNA-binding protein
MKQFIRDYLTFNKRERNGLFVLIAIITLMIVYLNISYLFIQPQTVDFTKFEKEIELFNASANHANDSLKNEDKFTYQKAGFKQYENDKKTTNSKTERFIFNPNFLSDKDWKRLGLTDKQIKSINNYQAKGGKFRNKEDVKKMYCISEKQYLSLEPYILIPIDKKEFSTFETTIPKLKNILVELNLADSTQLVSLKGIGAFYAKTIIKYRTLLGGFVAKEQLMEVWKFDSIRFEGVKNKITVDASNIKKININTCTAAELKHPYLTWNTVNVICNYRSKHGNYKTVEEIKKTDLVDEITYRKIAPYLVTE